MSSQPRPEDLYNGLVNNQHLKNNAKGEGFAWHASSGADLFVKGYRVWRDTAWLDWGCKYYDFLLEHWEAGPDGYKGLFGPNYRHKLWSNEEVSDALCVNPALEFCEAAQGVPALRNQYRHKIDEYIAFAQKHVIEKWDARGWWHECGGQGDYIFGYDYVQPNDLTKWVMEPPGTGSGTMSQKYNIANKLGITNIRLYRLTGEQFYRDKAEKLFFRLKSDFQLVDNHYTWNYWNPFYEKDIYPDRNACIHWIGTHPYRPGYQATEVSQIVEAYHTGIVFDEEDIRRIIRTNLKVMWNRDLNNPEYIMSTGDKPLPEFADLPGERKNTCRGTLWTSLAGFDETIRALHRRQSADARSIHQQIGQAYFEQVTCAAPPSFARHHVQGRPVIVKSAPYGNSFDLHCVKVIPHIIRHGQTATIVTKSKVPGDLAIELCSADGKNSLAQLFAGAIQGDPDGVKGLRMLPWNGLAPAGTTIPPGEYLVRWILNGKYRDQIISIEDTK